jgi:hypothetical protein
VGGKAPDGALTLKGQVLSGPLGPLERLDLFWRPPATAASTPVTEAKGSVLVRAEPRGVYSEAKIELRVLGGQVRAWRMLVPPEAEVKAEDPRVERVDVAGPLRTIHLKEATADPLEVTVRSLVPTPKGGAGKPMAVGPFNVLEAVRQTGAILVATAAPEMHLEYRAHGDVKRRPLTAEERKRDGTLVAAFQYGPSAASGRAWLEVEAQTVTGQLTARPSHILRLTEEAEGGAAWSLETALTVTPRWPDAGRLIITLPPGCEWDPDAGLPLPPRVRPPTFDRTTRALEFRLEPGGEGGGAPFTIRFAARYQLPPDTPLPLPRPAAALEPGGTLTLTAPSSLEVLPGEAPGLELARQTPHEVSYRIGRRQPPAVAVRWRPYQPPVEVAGTVSVVLGPGEGRVRHELSYTFPAGEAPKKLRLRLPPAPAGAVTLREGKAEREGSSLVFSPAATGMRLALEYSFPTAPGLTEVPLAAAEGVTRADQRVRVWSEGGRLPTLGPCKWVEAAIEEVPGFARLPCLVARPLEPGEALRLRIPEGSAEPQLLVSRALVRVELAEAGAQSYRVSYRIERFTGPVVDLELPGHAAAISLHAALEGRRIDHEVTDPRTGRAVRIRVAPSLAVRPVTLDLSYHLQSPGISLSAPLAAPRLPGAAGFPARWQITVPSGWVVLGPDSGPAPRAWRRAGWLLAPAPATSPADLERWLTGEDAAEADGDASLVLWRDGGEDVTLTLLPRQAWLLGCSLLACGLGLFLVRLASTAPGWGWGLGLCLLAVGIVTSALWPGLACQVAYGCQPALAVLALAGAGAWVVHERRRRRLVYLPSFTRARPGSTMTRPEQASSQKPSAQEAQQSTVDAPRAFGSGIGREVG